MRKVTIGTANPGGVRLRTMSAPGPDGDPNPNGEHVRVLQQGDSQDYYVNGQQTVVIEEVGANDPKPPPENRPEIEPGKEGASSSTDRPKEPIRTGAAPSVQEQVEHQDDDKKDKP